MGFQQMRVSTKFLATAASAAISLTLASAPAHAVTIESIVPPGPFSTPGDVGTINANLAGPSDTYIWEFSTLANLDAVLQLQGASTGGTHQNIQFSLYSGSYSGVHSLLKTSLNTTGPSFSKVLAAGDYYVELDPANIHVSPELISGSVAFFSAGVPEPATWATMILGFGLLGLASRRRRAMSFAAAA